MKIIFKFVFLVLLFTSNSFAEDRVISVPWNSSEGIKRFESSQFKNDFFELADHFQPQINQFYCGPATSVIILNAISHHGESPSQKDLEAKAPKAFGYNKNKIEFKTYSQLTFLNDKTNKIKDRKIVELQNITPTNENDVKNFDPGLTLAQLRDILSKTYNLKVKLTYVENADNKTVNEFRSLVKKVVVDNKKYLVSNFNGQLLGQKTRGHISPIIAYDESSDSVLVMDVAGHKNGWYWAEIYDLVDAMNTKDGDKYRGYLVISK